MRSWMFAVFLLSLKVVEGSFPCKKNEYIIRNGSAPCLKCNDCQDGYGLHPPCGSTLDHPPKIECFPCKAGKYYSNKYDPSSCKRCHLCARHEIVTKKCTPESNTICSGTCYAGWYFENATHNCQPCSYCCGDSNDIIIKECKHLKQHCSIHNAQRCTPTTTVTATNITSVIATTTDGVADKPNHTVKIVAGIGGGLLAIVIIAVLVYCYRKRRKHIPAKLPGHRDAENGIVAQPLNACGVANLKCCLEIVGFREPYTIPMLLNEGTDLTLVLADRNNDDQCVNQCRLQWRKDGVPVTYCYDRKLSLNAITVGDSGKFQCQIYCQTHEQDKHSDEIVIHVQPVAPKRLTLLNEIGLDMEQKLGILLKLKPPDIGNWHNVGEYYRMDKDYLKSIEDDDDRADKVLKHLNAKCPDLTVFEFCEYLKTIGQFKTVNALKKDLTRVEEKIEEDSTGSINELRDSGVEFDEIASLQVHLPPETKCSSTAAVSVHKLARPTDHFMKQHTNLSYSDSSREGSLDELPTIRESSHRTDYTANNQAADGKNGKKKKRSFNRQVSKDSQKSAGGMSISSLKDAVTAKVFKRHDYSEHKEEDTEEDEVV